MEQKILTHTGKHFDATVIVDAGYILQEGSVIRKQMTNSCPNRIRELREDLIEDQVLVYHNDSCYIMTDDYKFKSKSSVASFIEGASVSGTSVWPDEEKTEPFPETDPIESTVIKKSEQTNTNPFGIKLTHPSIKNRVEDVAHVFEAMVNKDSGVEYPSLDNFIGLLSDLADWKVKEKVITDDQSQKLKGDLFELFTEVFFKLNFVNPSVAVADFKGEWEFSGNDQGVDGLGINGMELPCAVQIKYRSNPTTVIDANDIKKTVCDAMLQFGIFTNTPDGKKIPNVIVLFTNCEGVRSQTKEYFGESLHVIHGGMIRPVVDGNYVFWKTCRDIVMGSL